MTDDDHIDDDQLKQMRSVWLSMRDDDAEPSDRGMAALMAAAREQAQAMKPARSWWAALLEQLRRPPVLAMATVVVLIGGAVVITQRGDEMRTESEMAAPAHDNPADEMAATAPAAEPTGAVAAKEEAPGATVERDHDDIAAGSAAATVAPAPVVTQRPRRHPERSAGRADHGLAFEPTKEPPPEAPAQKAAGAKKDAAKAPKLQLATGDDLQPKGGSVAETTSVAPPPASTQDNKPVSRKPLPSIEGEDRAAKDPTIAQLVKQCEAAAAKNDCAAVRTIARKIEKQDPSTYRSKLAKNAAVARCLEPPAPAEAAPANAQ